MSYREALKYFKLEELYTEKELKNSYNKVIKKNDDINKINSMYEILLNELTKRKIKEIYDSINKSITKLKEKYQDTEIYKLCLVYEKKLNEIISLSEIQELKTKFDNEIKALKNNILLPKEKDSLINSISKYLDGYSKDIKKVIEEYIDIINKTDSLDKLNSVKQKLETILKKELKIETKRVIDFKARKDLLKKEMVSNFYNASLNLSSLNIKLAHNLLITVLSLLNNASISNLDKIENIIKNVDYNNLKEEITRLKLYNLGNSPLIEIDKINLKVNNKKEIHEKHNELVDILLDKYLDYTNKKSTTIEKLIEDKSFNETIDIINKVKSNDIDKIISYVENQSFKAIRYIIEGINSFNNPSNIFIERDTGNLCVNVNSGKRIYTIFLDGVILTDLKTERDIIWKYISLSQFFSVAKFSNKYEIVEMSDKNSIIHGDYNINYLYYTKDLMLCLDENNGKCFRFIPAQKGYDFVLGENEQITRNSYFDYYQDKDKCIKDIIKSNNIEITE